MRQLRNIVEGLVVTIPRREIGTEDLPLALVSSVRPERTFSVRPGMSLAQVEAELIRQTLVNVTSNRAEAAKNWASAAEHSNTKLSATDSAA